MFPAATHRGGVERAVWEALRHLGARHPTTFVGTELDAPELLPPVVHVRPDLPRWGVGALRPAAFRTAARAAVARDAGATTMSFGVNAPAGDVLVVNSLHRSWLQVGQPVELRGVRVPNAARYALPRHHVLLALEWSYFTRSDPRAVVAVSARVGEELTELYGVDPALVRVVHNGFDPEQCNPERRATKRDECRHALGIGDDAVVLLFVANELHRKGLGVLLDAVASVDDARLEVHVVGRTPLDDYAEQIITLGLQARVIYHGPVADIGVAHAFADALVLPTQYEAFALTVVEALASGLPVITTTVPGAGDLIDDGVNGLLLHDPTDVEELTALLARVGDAGTRARWSGAAAGSVAGLDWPTLMGAYEATLLAAR